MSTSVTYGPLQSKGTRVSQAPGQGSSLNKIFQEHNNLVDNLIHKTELHKIVYTGPK